MFSQRDTKDDGRGKGIKVGKDKGRRKAAERWRHRKIHDCNFNFADLFHQFGRNA
jgi:hypothetical protein